jgi:hypothetical protein
MPVHPGPSSRQVRYVERPFRDDIADQKNVAIEQATCDWVFVLNSDETVRPEFRNTVGELMGSWRHSAYEFPRYRLCSLDALMHITSSRIYPNFQLRLFRNRPFWMYRRYNDEHGFASGRVHHQFPSRGRGWVRRVANAHLYHFDCVFDDRETREQKVARYDAIEPRDKKTHRQYYSLEDLPFERVKVVYPLEQSVIICAQSTEGPEYTESLAECDAVMVLAEQWFKEAVNLGIPREQIVQVSLGIDAQRFRPGSASERNETPEKIGTSRRLLRGRLLWQEKQRHDATQGHRPVHSCISGLRGEARQRGPALVGETVRVDPNPIGPRLERRPIRAC